MKTAIRIVLISLSFSFLAGCGKDNSPKPVTPNDSTVVIIPVKDTTEDIYISGSHGDTLGYWKNGTFVPGGYGPILFSGTDMYIGGTIGTQQGYWKNGLFHAILNTDSVFMTSMSVYGQDVYSFFQYSIYPFDGFLYKNDVFISKMPSMNFPVQMASDANGAYVPGSTQGVNSMAVYWKNDQQIILPSAVNFSTAYYAALSGQDIYIAGTVLSLSGYRVATYWKNGNVVYLSDSTSSFNTNMLQISGNDVYVAGNTWPERASENASVTSSIYFKNGELVTLTPPGTDEGMVGFVVNGSDVYATVRTKVSEGFYSFGCYKNGKIIFSIPPRSGSFDRIYVHPR